MAFKNLPSWLRGGIIIGVIGGVWGYFVANILEDLCKIIPSFDKNPFMCSLSNSFIQHVLVILLTLVIFFLLGVFCGFLVGRLINKLKGNSKQKTKKK